MRILLKIYSAYGLLIFALLFLILLPFFLLAMFVKPLEKMASTLNWIWARGFFFMMFFNRTQISYEQPLDRKQSYIFCANHFSYLDIPTMGLIRHNFKFIGKSSLRKVPVWGYMYSKLHILVNRESLKDRYASWAQAREALKAGFSIVFFAEGGILSQNPPEMARFKEGSFKLAIEEQIPIVPVTIHRNHIILPDEKPLVIRTGKVSLKVHSPIWPAGNDEVAVKALKNEVRGILEAELDKTNSHRDNNLKERNPISYT